MKIIFYGVLCFGIWTAASTYWYLCQIENMCPTEVSNSATAQNIDTDAIESEVTDMPAITEEERTIEKEELGSAIDFDKTLIYYFDFNDEHLHENLNAKEDFLFMLEYLKARPEILIQITGHTDNIGNEKDNHALGLERAEQTAKILQENGIAIERIEVLSAGERKPIAGNTTEQGRAKNRRIEIDIIK